MSGIGKQLTPTTVLTGGLNKVLKSYQDATAAKSPKYADSTTTTTTTEAGVGTPESPLVRKRKQQAELLARSGGGTLLSNAGGETLG